MRQWRIDRIAGLIAVAAGGISIWEAVRLYPFHAFQGIGDHVFPGLIGLGLLLSGALLWLRPAESETDGGRTPAAGPVKWKIAAVPVMLFGYTLVLPWLGFPLSTLTAAFLLFRIIGGYRRRTCLLMAALVTVSMVLVFVEWLNTPLPAGKILPFKEWI